MPIPVVVPRLGWTMEEGTFVEWLKADGDPVRPGDAVFRLEGEKAAEEIECLDGGVLRIPPGGPKPGDRVVVGAVIGFLVQPGEAAPSLPVPASRPPAPVEDRVPTAVAAEDARAQPAISPRACRLANRHGLDWSRLRGTGRNGRVRERDVAAALGTTSAIPHTAIRKATAARMVESARTTAPVTLTTSVDATSLVALRERFKSEPGPVPSFTDLFVKLTALALQQHPVLTSRWTDDALHTASRIDIGIAVDTDAGLLVPVVRDVPALDLRALVERTLVLIEQARNGRLAARDLDGGCFTITNLGPYGIDAFTPIINPPQCGVLGVGRIARRPAVVGEAIVPRDQVTLSLTFDHRVVDGGPAARFLQTLTRMIEDPQTWVWRLTMKCDLDGHVSLVTGAARGIGKAIADRLAANGSVVYYTDLDVGEAAAAASSSPNGRGLHLDVTDATSIEVALKHVMSAEGRLDILVNNAGINTLTHRVPLDQFPRSEWDRILAVDLTGVYEVSRLAAGLMRPRRSGRIINIASIVGLVPLRLQCAYVAAKAGVVNLTRAMALELGPDGILVNGIAPGSTLTDGTRKLFYGEDGLFRESVKRMLEHVPLGRPANVDEIAVAALFLADPENTYMNGHILTVDGGWTAGYARDF